MFRRPSLYVILCSWLSFCIWRCHNIKTCRSCISLVIFLFIIYFTALFRRLRLCSVGRKGDKWWTGKDLEGSGGCLILRYYPGIRLEGLRETTRNLCQDCRSPIRDLNSRTPEYEARVLISRPRRSVTSLIFCIQFLSLPTCEYTAPLPSLYLPLAVSEIVSSPELGDPSRLLRVVDPRGVATHSLRSPELWSTTLVWNVFLDMVNS
jgi:hypothetical protein